MIALNDSVLGPFFRFRDGYGVGLVAEKLLTELHKACNSEDFIADAVLVLVCDQDGCGASRIDATTELDES